MYISVLAAEGPVRSQVGQDDYVWESVLCSAWR